MNEVQSAASNEHSATPPTRAGTVPASTLPSTWPTILGVISIIFGLGAAVMYGLCGPIMTLFMPMMAESFQGIPGGEASAAQMSALDDLKWLIIGMNLMLGIAGVLLLIAGTGILRRRAWCMRLVIIWAIGKIILSIPNGFISHHINKVQMDAMREASAQTGGQNAPPAVLFGLVDSLSVIGIIVGIAWAIALPVFMLFWFGRRKVRTEIAGWRDES